MGQYFLIVNISKRQYINPQHFDSGGKLQEMANGGSSGSLVGLALLLADGNGRGGGDFNSTSPLVGSWAGDKIVIAGDYADPGKFVTAADARKAGDGKLINVAASLFKDVSGGVLVALAEEDGESPVAKRIRESHAPKAIVKRVREKTPKKEAAGKPAASTRGAPHEIVLTPEDNEVYWDIVSDIGWGDLARRKSNPKNKGKVSNAQLYVISLGVDLRKVMAAVTQQKGFELKHRFSTWCAKNKVDEATLPVRDASFWDLIDHVVGLGKAEYAANMKNPALILKRMKSGNYEENFSYLFL